MTLRDRVYSKYNGRCAYTGKPLGNDWQIDHVKPIRSWLVGEGSISGCTKAERAHIRKEANRMDNLLPCNRIINHYKRSLDLEKFRKYIAALQSRIDKLPKYARKAHNGYYEFSGKLCQLKQIKRACYIHEIAEAFGITPDTPFRGKFWFEREEP